MIWRMWTADWDAKSHELKEKHKLERASSHGRMEMEMDILNMQNNMQNMLLKMLNMQNGTQ